VKARHRRLLPDMRLAELVNTLPHQFEYRAVPISEVGGGLVFLLWRTNTTLEKIKDLVLNR
jgi:hypothetical protein